jgi:hypothetical protein
MTGKAMVSGIRETCWDWYITYLDARIDEVWPTIAVKILNGVRTDTTMATTKARAKVYEILFLIASSIEESSIKDDHERTLNEMASALRCKDFIKDDAHPLAVQFVFNCIGWLTAIFDPSPDPAETHLSMRNIGHNFRRRGLVRRTIIRHSSVAIGDANRPLHQLLGRFGSLLPRLECVRRSQAAGGLEGGSECMIAAYISFHSLQQVLNVKIEWVDVLNQHLEFDQRNAVLKVFRLPSICRLLYRDVDGTLLSQLFQENEKEQDENFHMPHSHIADIQDFLVEVLLSYRVIFGRQRRSRARIRASLQEKQEKWQSELRYDPLLEILCTEPEDSHQVQELYNDLEAKRFDDYISVDEFPFLARRLFDLQRFSMAQNPHSWRRLWADRRNITVWFTIWAVVIIGGSTLVFQVLQLVFQIYQAPQH